MEDKYDGKIQEEWWASRFPEKPVIYNAQDSRPRDVRNFIFPKSYILEDIVKKYKLAGKTPEDTMYKCCLFVIDYIKYVGDLEARGQQEYWQTPEDTIARRQGDCEDGAILMKSLALCAGIPDWRVKIVAGNVTGGGHAYCTFIRDDDVQVICDWCYWPNRLPMKARQKFEDEANYQDVWFSFNYAKTYAAAKIVYKDGKIVKKKS